MQREIMKAAYQRMANAAICNNEENQWLMAIINGESWKHGMASRKGINNGESAWLANENTAGGNNL